MALEYCHPALQLSREEFDKVMRQVVKSVLAKMRISANFRRSLIHVSPEEEGFPNLYVL